MLADLTAHGESEPLWKSVRRQRAVHLATALTAFMPKGWECRQSSLTSQNDPQLAQDVAHAASRAVNDRPEG